MFANVKLVLKCVKYISNKICNTVHIFIAHRTMDTAITNWVLWPVCIYSNVSQTKMSVDTKIKIKIVFVHNYEHSKIPHL